MSISWLWYLIGTLCVGGLIALPLLLAETVLRRPLVLAHFRLVYLAAILITLFPLGRNRHWAAQTELPAASWDWLTVLKSVDQPVATPPPVATVPPVAMPVAAIAADTVSSNLAVFAGEPTPEVKANQSGTAAVAPQVKHHRRPGLAFYLVVLYSFSVLFLWAKQIWRLFLWRKRIRECCAITHGRVFDLFTEAKRLTDCRFSVTLRDGGALLPIPASFGCGQWRTVLCPLREQENFSDAELKMLMIHELTHLKHSDNPSAFILCMVSNLCWFNPFIRLFVKRAVMGFELDCDNAVRRTMNLSGSTAASYAKLLLQYQLQGNNKALRSVLTSGLSTTAKELKLRIQELKMKSKRYYALLIIAIIISGVITGGCWAPSLYQDRKTPAVKRQDVEFSAQTAFKLFPSATRCMVYVDAGQCWQLMPFFTPSTSKGTMSIIYNFCKTNNVAFYAAWLPPVKDYASGGNFNYILLKADCKLADFQEFFAAILPFRGSHYSADTAELKLFFSPENQGDYYHITLTQVGEKVYFLSLPDAGIPADDPGVPPLLQDAFMQAATRFEPINMSHNGVDLQFKLDDPADNILVFAGMGQEDNYALHIGRPELTANDYNVQFRMFTIDTVLEQRNVINFCLNNIANPNFSILQNKYDSDSLEKLFLQIGVSRICPVDQLVAKHGFVDLHHEGKASYLNCQYILSNNDLRELGLSGVKERPNYTKVQLSPSSSIEEQYVRDMVYYGVYDSVREAELGMRLAASESGREFLRSFADKCGNILLSGQIKPDELAAEMNYADGYQVNSADTPERKNVSAIRLLMADVVSADNWLQTPQKSVELFKELAAKQPQIAQYAWYVMRDTVMEHGDLALAAQFYSDPVAIFNDFAQNTTQIIDDAPTAQIINDHRARLNRTAKNLLKLAEYQKNSVAVTQITDGIKQFNANADERISKL